jgi:hypothetical protein
MKGAALVAVVVAVMSASIARADDISDVRAVLNAEIKMFATYDAKLAPGIFTPDVIWQNPFGVRFHGEAELVRFLTDLFNRPGYRSGKDLSAPVVTDVRMLGPGLASAWSEETSEGQTEAGKSIGLRKSHYLEVLRKQGGVWLITDEMIMDEK